MIAVACTAAIALTMAYGQPNQVALSEVNQKASTYARISDESLSYRYRNPDLHEWDPESTDPWVQIAAAARQLSEVLDTEIGVTRGGIGHFSYTGQEDAGRVYTYDVLGLSRLDVARLDMHGAKLRVGHAKQAPDVLIATNDRVDFHNLYFEGWADVATIEFAGRSFTLANPDLIEPLVAAGVMSADDAMALRAWILDRLDQPDVDRNFVTFLTLRYHRDDEVSARVSELRELHETSAWSTWLADTAGHRELLRPNGCFGWSLFECVGKALERHRIEPIPHLANESDWAPVS
jgi:hypothetical protein